MLTSSIRDSAVCCLHPRSPSFRRVSRENVVIIQHESWWAPLITKVENGAAVAPFWVSYLQMVVPDYLSNWLGDVWVGNLRAIDSPASWNQFTTPTFPHPFPPSNCQATLTVCRYLITLNPLCNTDTSILLTVPLVQTKPEFTWSLPLLKPPQQYGHSDLRYTTGLTIYTRVECSTVRVKWLPQQHNMSTTCLS